MLRYRTSAESGPHASRRSRGDTKSFIRAANAECPRFLSSSTRSAPKASAAADVLAVDRDDDAAVAVVVEDLVGESVDHVLPHRCQSSHAVSLI